MLPSAPTAQITFRSIVKKSRWSSDPPQKLQPHEPSRTFVAFCEPLPASDISMFLSDSPFSSFAAAEEKSSVTSDFWSKGGFVGRSPRPVTPSWCGLLAAGGSAARPLLSRTTGRCETATPAGCNAAMLHPQVKNTRGRWGVTFRTQILLLLCASLVCQLELEVKLAARLFHSFGVSWRN